jgi:hypothetical protein
MRSFLAAAGAAWFAYNSIWFIAQGAYVNSGSATGIDGDPAAVAITWAARVLFVGLALLALALIEWGKIVGFFRTTNDPE